MGVRRCEPKEEGLVLRAFPDVLHPILLLARTAPAGNTVEGSILVTEHVILSRKDSVVTGFPKEFGKTNLFLRQTDVELGSSGIVRVATGNDAASGRAAATCGQVGVFEAHALLGQGVDVGRLDDGMPVASEILLRDVVGNEENDVRFVGHAE